MGTRWSISQAYSILASFVSRRPQYELPQTFRDICGAYINEYDKRHFKCTSAPLLDVFLSKVGYLADQAEGPGGEQLIEDLKSGLEMGVEVRNKSVQ